MMVIEAMIAVAKADGVFKACEKRRILHLMGLLQLNPTERTRAQVMFESPDVPRLKLDSLPTYDSRRYIFQQALFVAYDDGFIHPKEVDELTYLADLLQIAPEHQAQAWSRTRDLVED